MRHLKTLTLVLVLVAAACGGDDDAADNNTAGGDSAGSGNDPAIMSTSFDLGALPDNFPSERVPPSWTAGQATDLLGPFVINFETDMSFADVVDHYEGVLGPKTLLVGDPGEQLAQWTGDAVWVTSIFDGDPVTVGFASLEE